MLQCGLDFRLAHRLVRHLVRQRLWQRRSGNWLTPDCVAKAAGKETVPGLKLEIPPQALRDALNPEAALAARTAPGGAAPEAVEAMLVECAQALTKAENWAWRLRAQLRKAEKALLQAVGEGLR